MSSSGHDASQDRAANDLEVMEFNEMSGEWIFSTISFDDAGVTKVRVGVPMCLNCHGDVGRPIWGDYPRWPTAYGGSTATPEKMEGQELTDFLAWKQIAPSHEAYKHLSFDFSTDHFYLRNTVYGYPNSVFTARLAVRTAQAIYTRARAVFGVARNSAAFAAGALNCTLPESLRRRVQTDYDNRIKGDPSFAQRWNGSARPPDTLSLATRLLDMDPTVDFQLDKFPAVAARDVSLDLQNPWNSGSDSLSSLVAFRFFYDVYLGDANLRAKFKAEAPAIESLIHDSLEATNERFSELDKPQTRGEYEDGLFPYLHTRVWKSADLKQAACDALVREAL